MIFNNLKKRTYFYIVVKNNDAKQYLTITNSKEEAFEYGSKLLQLEYSEHYVNWCITHEYKQDANSWKLYFNQVITDEDKLKYSVRKIYYTKQALSSILRMFCGCFPIGCSFDLPFEYAYIQDKLEAQNMDAPDNSDNSDNLVM